MSNYTITTDFGAKDSLPSSNDSKVVRGSEFTTEFTNIQTAIATKADTAGDTFTGVVNFSADVAVNTNTLFVDVSEAKVGIGTASPDTALDVEATQDTVANVLSNGSYAAKFSSSTTGDNGRTQGILLSGTSAKTRGVALLAEAQSTNNSHDFVIATSGVSATPTERMRIRANGNIGIGTTSPSEKLQVNGNIKIGDSHIIGDDGFDNLTLISSSDESIVYGSNTDHIFKTGATGLDATGTERMRITASGKVGLGTNSPSAQLHVKNNDAGFEVDVDGQVTDGVRLLAYDRNTSTDRNMQYRANQHLFNIGSSQAMRIDSSGNVGIGTTNPIRALHVNSGNDTIRLQSTSTNTKIEMVNTGSTTNEFGFLSNNFFVSPDGTEALRIDSSGKVGIGTTSPAANLHVDASAPEFRLSESGTAKVRLRTAGDNYINTGQNLGIGTSSPATKLEINGDIGIGRVAGGYTFRETVGGNERASMKSNALNELIFSIGASAEALRIDGSGNVLVGKTATTFGTAGSVSYATGLLTATVDGNACVQLNRLTSDGAIQTFGKDGTTVGSIGTSSGTFWIGSGDTGLVFDNATVNSEQIRPYNTATGTRDAAIDLGSAGGRFKDLHRSGSTYSTSDRNKKQDIRDLTDAEARVATVAKGSLKAFRYIDSVEAEGDEANIHFGIIAQDLKAAFEAEGLNANDYQVFKTSTYTDDDGVEQTTYSICYENLLAFIIAAI